jgi:hypothetical protein
MELIRTMFDLLPNWLLEPTPDGALGSYWVGVPTQEPFAVRIMVAVEMAISRPSA